jgi:Zinc carboxypeptidase
MLAPLAGAADQGAVPTPASMLGFRPGDDRKLADWNQIVDYFTRLDAASDRVLVENVGKTTEGRPFLVVTISSEANMARLEEIRQDNLRLADPRRLPDPEARAILARGKTIVALNHGIHSTEVAATQTAMETAYELATSQDPRIQEVLDRTVVLMLPSHNPDGTQRVTEWYRDSIGKPWEGSSQVPFLYHHYAGHDNNRDWYMFTQAESRLTVAFLYDRWRPQIVHDLHQMGSRSARIFAPPYLDPWEPNVDPALRAATSALGAHIAARLTSEGKSGVVIHAMYDGWTPARAYPHTHGGVRILTESASASLASPLTLKLDELQPGIGYDPRRAAWNFPLPWPGGTWRLRDIVDYQRSATLALLEHAAANREYWLRTFLDVNRRASARSEPYAYVIPAEQRDHLAAHRLLEVLRTGAVELHRARGVFEAAGRRFGAGSQVVLMAQPFSAFAKSLLERQQYPDQRQYPGGPPQRPYDVTAHTLPLLLGVDVAAVPQRFEADLEPVRDLAVTPGRISGAGRFFGLGHKTGELFALSRLLADGVAVRWSTAAFADHGRTFPAGTLLVPASARRRLETLVRELGISAIGVGANAPAMTLRRPRVGLYQSYVPSMDEGWTRYVFEREASVAYETLHDADIHAGLQGRFDVVIVPDESPRQIVTGNAPGSAPDEYVGGLGKGGVQALKAFVEAGGTLVTLNGASLLPITEMGLPVANAIVSPPREAGHDEEPERPTGSAEFYCPGAILRVKPDLTHPLAAGLDDPSIAWFEESPAFDVKVGRVVARYEDKDPLLSGWLLGGARLQGKAALVEVPLGKGRVVLFGYRPQYRAQSWATYIPLLNAIYTSAVAR